MPMSVNCPANPAVWFHLFANAFLFVGNGSAAQKKSLKGQGHVEGVWTGQTLLKWTRPVRQSLYGNHVTSLFFSSWIFFCLKAQIWLFLIFKAKLMPVERNYSMIRRKIFSFQLVAWVKWGQISDVIFSENALILVVIIL